MTDDALEAEHRRRAAVRELCSMAALRDPSIDAVLLAADLVCRGIDVEAAADELAARRAG